jgi:hypothetical protein
MIVINLVASKAGAKQVLLFNKPASDYLFLLTTLHFLLNLLKGPISRALARAFPAECNVTLLLFGPSSVNTAAYFQSKLQKRFFNTKN